MSDEQEDPLADQVVLHDGANPKALGEGQMHYVKCAGAILYTSESKADALRWAAAQAKFRPALFVVTDNAGNFIRSFDGR